MKKLVGLSLVVFVLIIAGLLFRGAFFDNNRNDSQLSQTPNNQISQSVDQNTKMSLVEISSHNSAENCWIIINNSVYNVTNFLNLHPGTPERIIPYCGKDATLAFQTKDQKRPQSHSSQAIALLKEYYIGVLVK